MIREVFSFMIYRTVSKSVLNGILLKYLIDGSVKALDIYYALGQP